MNGKLEKLTERLLVKLNPLNSVNTIFYLLFQRFDSQIVLKLNFGNLSSVFFANNVISDLSRQDGVEHRYKFHYTFVV